MQAVPKRNRLADSAAEGVVIGTGQDTVGGQTIRWCAHVSSISDHSLQSGWISQSGSATVRRGEIRRAEVSDAERVADLAVELVHSFELGVRSTAHGVP